MSQKATTDIASSFSSSMEGSHSFPCSLLSEDLQRAQAAQ